jgi:hypothetical protein
MGSGRAGGKDDAWIEPPWGTTGRRSSGVPGLLTIVTEVGAQGLLLLLKVELAAILLVCVAWWLGVPLEDWTSPVLRIRLRLSTPPPRRRRRRRR